MQIELRDYRDLRNRVDLIVTIGMFKHVGPRNYSDYFKSVGTNLATDGLFLLHTIGTLRETVEKKEANLRAWERATQNG